MKKNNKVLKIIIIIVIILIACIAIGIITYNANEKKYKYSLVEVNNNDIKYYLLEQDNKYGVIDKDGNLVIPASYEGLVIPNPTKDVFICSNSISEKAVWKAVDSSNAQIFKDYEDVEAISLKQITSSIPYEKSVLKYKSGAYYGLIDFNGKKITNAIYEDIKSIDYKEGCMQVKKDGKYGVINIKGTSIIKTEYDNITADGYYDDKTKYEEAGFIIRQKTDEGYRYGYADKRGKILLETNYNEISRINEIEDTKNIYLISSTSGKYGLVKNGKQILENEYDDINYDKTNRLIVLTKEKTQGVDNLEGKTIIPMDYNTITIGGSYISAVKENTNITFDASGNKLDTDLTSYTKVSDNYAIVIDKDNNYNVVDQSGNKLLTDKYAYIEYFSGNNFIATKDNKTGIINVDGKIVVPIIYSTIQKIENTNSLEATENSERRIDLIAESGKVKTGLTNASILVKQNYIKIYSSTEVKYFTTDAEETTYSKINSNNTIYAVEQNGKWGFSDKNGKIVIACQYEMVSEQNGNTAGIKLNGKWGVIDTKGNVLVNPKYTILWENVNFLGNYYEISDNVGVSIYCGDEQN